MSYVGNTNTTQAFTAAVDYFSGNGSTVAFTLSRPVASTAQVQVVVNNVPQNPTDAFTVLNNTITFTGAPSSGTNNIYVQYTSTINQIIQPSQGTVGTAQISNSGIAPRLVSDQTNTSTGSLSMPVGTTAQRPATPTTGMFRMNSTTGSPEWYDALSGTWVVFATLQPYSVEYIVVAGGAGGGGVNNVGSGGGGAGGYRTGSVFLAAGDSQTVTVGGGGAGGLGSGNGNSGAAGSNGSNSVFGSVTSLGGGGGGVRSSPGPAASGGSGGGGGGGAAGAAGTTGQGFAGANSAAQYQGGGGGGASAAATNVNGGSGISDTWTGSSRALGGGGGGGGGSGNAAGTGGSGGGGNGNGGAGTANTGGGGAGSYAFQALANGGAGGSGVVVLRYLGAQRGSGGTVTSSGGYTIHTFTTSGTYTA